MSDKKKHHYLPVFYLRGFSPQYFTRAHDRKGDLLWVLDLSKQLIRTKAPHNVAWENHYYGFVDDKGSWDNSIEDAFSITETHAAQALQRIDREIGMAGSHGGFRISRDDVVSVKLFLFLQMSRVPVVMDDIRIKAETYAQDKDWITTPADVRQYSSWLTMKVLTRIGSSNDFLVLRYLMAKNVTFFVLPRSRADFITCDNPVLRWRKSGPNGIRYSDTEIYFPLNQRLLIVLHGYNRAPLVDRVTDLSLVQETNSLLALQATRYLFARHPGILKETAVRAGFGDIPVRMPDIS